MIPILLQQEGGWYGYRHTSNETMFCVTTHDFLTCIEVFEYPKKLLILLDEQNIIFSRSQLTIQQEQPYNITQRKSLHIDIKKDMEVRYQTNISYRRVECCQVLQNNIPQKHLLGCKGTIYADLFGYSIHHRCHTLLEILDREQIQYEIYPKSYAMLRYIGSQDVNYIIIHKHNVQFIERKCGCYERIHTLNVGWLALFDLFVYHNINNELLHKQELSPIQEQVVYGIIKEFIDPILQWIKTFASHGSRYLISDMLQYPLFIKGLQQILKNHNDTFVAPYLQHHTKVFQSPMIEAYLHPLIFGKVVSG